MPVTIFHEFLGTISRPPFQKYTMEFNAVWQFCGPIGALNISDSLTVKLWTVTIFNMACIYRPCVQCFHGCMVLEYKNNLLSEKNIGLFTLFLHVPISTFGYQFRSAFPSK